MECQDFLARYSEYFDEVMDFADTEQMRRHLDLCARCMRYDGVMRRGLDLARALEPIRPSSDFQVRLEHRLLHVRDEVGADGRMLNSGATVSLALAGLLALAAWGPLLGGDRMAAPTVAAEAALPAAVYEDQGEPAVATLVDGWWRAGTYGGTASFVPSARMIGSTFPGPHSPLVVTPPPVYYNGAAVRTVLMALPGID